MFGPNVTGGISFTKILGGLSRTLSIANQAIPLYKEIKPMIGNARKVMSVLKEFNNTPKSTAPKAKNFKTTIDATTKKEVTNDATSNPVFFQ